ncbi:phosphatidylserine decarboxylase [Marasmius tenuissimus]|uniref:Phosphatidylserine decarboxylase n=1 Tax=Marasmius tenuissimus TaxID=585030 RepID=A0ABR3A0G6_9AGAR
MPKHAFLNIRLSNALVLKRPSNALLSESLAATLRVQVVACSNLPARDFNGLSDPYVKVSLGTTTFKTPVMRYTLNPVYDAKKATFDFPIETCNPLPLKFVVWDKDWIGKDYLGQTTLDARDWFLLGGQNPRPLAWSTAEILESFSIPLTSSQSDAASHDQADIQLRLGFVDADLEGVYGRLVI